MCVYIAALEIKFKEMNTCSNNILSLELRTLNCVVAISGEILSMLSSNRFDWYLPSTKSNETITNLVHPYARRIQVDRLIEDSMACSLYSVKRSKGKHVQERKWILNCRYTLYMIDKLCADNLTSASPVSPLYPLQHEPCGMRKLASCQ